MLNYINALSKFQFARGYAEAEKIFDPEIHMHMDSLLPGAFHKTLIIPDPESGEGTDANEFYNDIIVQPTLDIANPDERMKHIISFGVFSASHESSHGHYKHLYRYGPATYAATLPLGYVTSSALLSLPPIGATLAALAVGKLIANQTRHMGEREADQRAAYIIMENDQKLKEAFGLSANQIIDYVTDHFTRLGKSEEYEGDKPGIFFGGHPLCSERAKIIDAVILRAATICGF